MTCCVVLVVIVVSTETLVYYEWNSVIISGLNNIIFWLYIKILNI